MVSIASGGKSYESSHNCYYGKPVPKPTEEDDVNQRDTSNEKQMRSPRANRRSSLRYRTNVSLSKKKPEETYEQRRERVFKRVSANNLDDSLHISINISDHH